jgi:hypothetical protein
MTVRIPYLSGLARRAPRTAVLRPPRPLFIGDSSTPAGAPVRPDSEDPAVRTARGGWTATRGWPGSSDPRAAPVADPNAAQTTPSTGSPALPTAHGASTRSRTAANDGAAGGGISPGSPGEAAAPVEPVSAAVVAPAPRAVSHRRPPGRLPATAAAGDTPPAPVLGDAGAVSYPGTGPAAPAAPGPLAAAPTTWTDPRWGLPAPLPPGTATLRDDPATAEDRTRRAAPALAAGHGRRPVGAASAPDVPPGAEATITPPTEQPLPELRPTADPAAARASDPQPLAVRPAAGHPGPSPHHRRSAVGRLSIGTIEVTVTAPATPPGPHRQSATRRPRPAMAQGPTSPPADPLRDGRRRWYGTAQG